IAYGIEKGDLGNVASSTKVWEVALGSGILNPAQVDTAYHWLRQSLAVEPECYNLKAQFYLGILELYHQGQPDLAAIHLDCIDKAVGLEFKRESQLPMSIILGLQSDVKYFRQQFFNSGFPADTLPVNLRHYVQDE
ncbi:MAG: hypothetical protein AAFY76_23120, partial [Cyanobacteria bacterium J06649_11]